jgi:L,D-transpeptidase YcbB
MEARLAMVSRRLTSHLSRRSFCGGLLAAIGTAAGANPASGIRDFLASGVGLTAPCSPERAALEGSISRLASARFPDRGKFVLVNLPAGRLLAYEDGIPALEMKAIIGKPNYQTPLMNTRVTAVRLNPTWTVPWSIVREDEWHKRLIDEPDFFTRNRFELRDSSGNLVPIAAAQRNPKQVTKFVQAPGRYNALGEFRFNIASSEAIYLHDTRDRQDFHEGGPITRSHGCVRLEDPKAFAKWLLGVGDDWLDEKMWDGSTRDFTVKENIPIVLGYFTAWPSADGEILIYDDVYGMDGSGC